MTATDTPAPSLAVSLATAARYVGDASDTLSDALIPCNLGDLICGTDADGVTDYFRGLGDPLHTASVDLNRAADAARGSALAAVKSWYRKR